MANEERARFYTFDPATREVSAFGNNVVAWAMAGGGLYNYRTDRVGRLTVATVFYGYDLRAAPAPEDTRPHFRALRELRDSLGLEHLSMGMSHDFEVAIEEGATLVRIGQAIFGGREE